VAEGRSEVEEATRQLLRINFDSLAGHLDGGVEAWHAAGRPMSAFKQLEGTQMRRELDSARLAVVLDVREDDEWQDGHIPGAVHIPLWQLPARAAELPRETPLIVHCAHGYRSSIASSILERAGFSDITHVMGGYDGWVATRPSAEAAGASG
jgi:hydroxyacylglutathione hydrolase